MESIRYWRAGNGPIPAARILHRAVVNPVVAAVMLAGIAACARTSTENVMVHATSLPMPQLIIVHDFVVSASDVSLNTAIGARLLELAKGTPEAEEQLKVARSVSTVLTQNLVEDIGKLGIPTQPASAASPVSGPTLSIEGQFVAIDQGNRLRRMVIGFGAGASEVRALVQVYEMTDEGRRLVEDFYTTVKSSRKPGMGPMVGVGAAAGTAATSAAVASGVGLATEISQTVEGDAKNMAKEIMKVLSKFFAEQGWITSAR